ncbi:MAG TPA: sigma-70 family RNA polymerase sigma factor [Nocardioidaceae bacterium]|nr:sigma-70 family RNA polymerase sigma factor [Nocardioidaceae bacterium]
MEPEREADYVDYASARWSSLVRSAVFLGLGLDDAQDVAQTTLVRCFVSWRRVSRARNRDAYTYGMLLNVIRDRARRPSRREVPVADAQQSGSIDPGADLDIADAIHRALSHLNREQREVVVLRHMVGLTEVEVSQVLNVPVGTVKSRTSRGLALLALDSQLTDQAGEIGK